MFDSEKILQQAISAYAPSDAVFARVKARLRERFEQIRSPQSSVVLICVNKDSPKIFKSVFKKYQKLMQKIA